MTPTLARWERRLRPLLSRLPPPLALRLYSHGRKRFVERFAREVPGAAASPEGLERTLWGVRFRAPVFNAAGMFKNGDGYAVCLRQGAGAYLAGTTTHRPRAGNAVGGTSLPFAPYPRSGAASNWLGLPNLGHRAVAAKLAALPRHYGFPIGASVAATAEDGDDDEARLAGSVAGMRLYEEAGVDFLEINESCPNTADDVRGMEELRARLEHLRQGFLERRGRFVPVLVKFSCDTLGEQVPELVTLLVELGFDGVNFGNTSTAYGELRAAIAAPERKLYDHFTRRCGGGVSGRPLKRRSLELAAAAVDHLRGHPPAREFHVVRTGGVEDAADLRRSSAAGVALVQWYSGYFEAFACWGHAVYRELYRDLRRQEVRLPALNRPC